MSDRPKPTSKGVFKALTEPIPPRPDIPRWEPVGPEGKGGYEWGRKPDGDMGFIPGGISTGIPTVFPFAHDVGGIVHVAHDEMDELKQRGKE